MVNINGETLYQTVEAEGELLQWWEPRPDEHCLGVAGVLIDLNIKIIKFFMQGF